MVNKIGRRELVGGGVPNLKLLSSHNFSSKVGKLRLHLPLTLKTSECKTHVVIGSFFKQTFIASLYFWR